MLPNRTDRIQGLSNARGRWDAIGVVPQIKLGDDTNTYIAADNNEKFIEGKTGTAGFTYRPDGTSINPGRTLRHFIDFPFVSYNGKAFHPLADQQPSTTVFPYPVFVSSMFTDPDIETLANVWSILQAIGGAL